ncbi:TerB family tellurite resistance protein [Hellea balneolensis]|uniref:TerB family tellurite resistance protein n=1 Tax=Hellea balneolensis TaxID=287478 RepID=UPI0003FA26E9|nr:TerB family tellurite resistance protein [Hellea balneolensis]
MDVSRKTDDILSLLVATILADKRVYAREIDTFLKAAKKLAQLPDAPVNLSEAKLLLWYETNSDSIKDKLSSSKFEPWLDGCLSRLRNLKGKRYITDIMTEIANADDEFHVSEKALLVLTAKHWNMDIQLH